MRNNALVSVCVLHGARVQRRIIEAGIETIGLNVEHNNPGAIVAYERLGFRTAFEYWEGMAVRKRRS